MNPVLHNQLRRRAIVAVWASTAAVFSSVPARAAEVDYEIVGVSNPEIVENIEATLSIVRDKDRDDLTPERVARLHERAPLEIQRAVEPFGYYRAVVEGSLTSDDKEMFRARYVVTLGEPLRVRGVSVSVIGEGKDQPPFPDLVAKFPLEPGDVLDQRLYTRAKTAFASAAADSGFLDASFTANTIRIHRGENVADVEIGFDTGPQYHFGAVVFDSTAIDDRVLRAYVTFKKGDPFRYSKLLAFQSALGGAPYFSRVEAVARRDVAVNHEVPIQVKLAMRRPRRYEVGVGYGTDTGPRILFNAEFRRLNRMGHHYTGKLNVSELELSLYAAYVMPSLHPKVHTYTIGALAARIDPDAYTTDRFAVGPTRSQPRFGWLESITLSYEWEDYTVGSDQGTTDLVIAGLSYRYKRANDDIAPTHGHRLDLSLRGAAEKLLSTESFVSFTASAKGVRSARGLRFVARVDGGVTWTPSFRELPPTIRYFAGGDNSVRGYDYQSLGPLDDQGDVIGGRFLLTTSVEIQVPIKGKFGLAGFYDAGNAFAHAGEGTMEQGVGPGLRWESPVGPIRLDLAYAIHHDSWQVHFTMGPDL